MRKIGALLVALGISALLSTYAQGITFTNGLTWNQVLQKARKEQKLILVDCYTTWCVPCKKMEKEVYPLTEVGEIANRNFISVKIQMDTTKNDDAQIKKWYADKHKIETRYNVRSYPTYLFFSPEGDLVFRDAGAKKADKFAITLQTAADSGIAYANHLKNWKSGKKDYTLVPSMILKAESLKDNETANMLARECITNYFPTLKGNDLYNKDLILAISLYLTSEDKKITSLFYPSKNGLKTDSLINRPGTSESITKLIIEKDINKMLVKNNDYTKPIVKNPDWNEITNRISNRYTEMPTEKLVLSAKKKWYRIARLDWNELTRTYIYELNKYTPNPGKSERFSINNRLFNDVFKNVTDTQLLIQAADIMKKVVDNENKETGDASAAYSDTYANLLFKAGRQSEAISWQQKAVILRPDINVFKETLNKMQKGEPTWE